VIKEGNPGQWACIIRDMELLKRAAFEQFGIRLDNRHLDAFRRYEEMLVAWSAVHNLTAIHEPDDIRIRHFLTRLAVSSPCAAHAQAASSTLVLVLVFLVWC
jgi:16S rRNA G527 N7-methylase RsmG